MQGKQERFPVQKHGEGTRKEREMDAELKKYWQGSASAGSARNRTVDPEPFEIGSRVHCALYGGNDGIVYRITGEQTPNNVRSLGGGCVVMGGSAYLDVVFEDGHKSNVPESIVRGVQWKRLEGIATEQEILDALEYARKTQADKEEKAKKDQAAFKAEVERIKATYPKLIQGGDCVTAAKNIRTELKQAFPSVKFSVKTEKYSGGNSVNIYWTDGPTDKQVKEIVDKYQEGHFDGMIDCYEYSRSPWTDVFGGSRYVSTNRSFSDKLVTRAIVKIAEEYGINGIPTVEDYTKGQAYGSPFPDNGPCDHYWTWQSLINRTAGEIAL